MRRRTFMQTIAAFPLIGTVQASCKSLPKTKPSSDCRLPQNVTLGMRYVAADGRTYRYVYAPDGLPLNRLVVGVVPFGSVKGIFATNSPPHLNCAWIMTHGPAGIDVETERSIAGQGG